MCFAERKEDEDVEFYSDTAKHVYEKLLPKFFPKDHIKYGQLMKIYSGNRLDAKIRKPIYGNVKEDEIETTNIENFHSILRERVGRLVRKTKCFSKLEMRLMDSLELFRFYWNFSKTIDGRSTPAMRERISKNKVKWHEFLYFHITILD